MLKSNIAEKKIKKAQQLDWPDPVWKLSLLPWK